MCFKLPEGGPNYQKVFRLLKKPKDKNPKKKPKPENITDEIREKEAEKIVFRGKIESRE